VEDCDGDERDLLDNRGCVGLPVCCGCCDNGDILDRVGVFLDFLGKREKDRTLRR